jgi:RNA polymerase sigma-70 factor (ECF subfamily)
MASHTAPEQVRQVLERALTRLCPDWLQSSRDDLIQSAMLRILEKHGSNEGNRSLNSSYLYKTAHSVMIDEIRRVQRRSETPIEPASRIEDDKIANPYQTTVGQSIATALRDCLSKLTRSRRLGVALHLQGHRVPEIAHLLGWQAKQADNSVYRGLADLRQCLKDRGFEPA